MSATVGSDKLPLCILITNAITNKTMQSNADVSQLNYFIIFKNSQGGQENNSKMADIIPKIVNSYFKCKWSK